MNTKSKVLALVLALMMLLAFSLTAMADYEADAKKFPTSYEGKTVILHTNDVHGALEGYAYIPELRDQLTALGAEVITVDAGDFSQGNTYVSYFKGASAVTMMNAAGYDVVTLGNHEFDFGYQQLMDNLKEASFTTIIAASKINGTVLNFWAA